MTSPATAPRRVLGLDSARGLAVVAMVIAHALPFVSERVSSGVTYLLLQVNDLASPLFALVMGVAAGLVFPGPSAPRGLARASVRGLALILLGVGLERLDHWVAVILHILGVLVIVGTPLLLLGSRWLLGIAVALVLVSPTVVEAVTRAGGGVAGGAAPTAGWAGNPLVEWLVLDTHYRVLTLLPLFLVGAVLARRGLDERSSCWCLMGGLAMFWASLAAELLGRPVAFSGDHTDQLQENGLALAAYGFVMATAIAGERRGVHPVVLGPLARVGTVALSLYVAHVALLVPVIPAFPGGGWLPFVGFVGVSVLAAWGWARFVGQGPLEWVLNRMSPARRPRVPVPA